jgi:hypothetical protein
MNSIASRDLARRELRRDAEAQRGLFELGDLRARLAHDGADVRDRLLELRAV